MKRIWWSLFLLASLWGSLEAATRGDVKVLEATDSIRYNAIRLTREYLLYVLYPNKVSMHDRLQRRLAALETDMHDIAVSTKDPKTKEVLEYFAFEKVHIDEILNQKPTLQHAGDLIDFSESFVEGATSIARRHSYVPAPEEKMWIATRSLDQEIEEVIKYYLATLLIKDDPQLPRKQGIAMTHAAEILAQLNTYPYAGNLKPTRARINQLWETLKIYLGKHEKLPLPIVATLMGNEIESSVDALGVFHSKNQ